VQQAASGQVASASIDPDWTREAPAQANAEHWIRLEVVKLSKAKCHRVLGPRRCVAERSFAYLTRFQRTAAPSAIAFSDPFMFGKLTRVDSHLL
jgi:hypothetical protein